MAKGEAQRPTSGQRMVYELAERGGHLTVLDGDATFFALAGGRMEAPAGTWTVVRRWRRTAVRDEAGQVLASAKGRRVRVEADRTDVAFSITSGDQEYVLRRKRSKQIDPTGSSEQLRTGTLLDTANYPAATIECRFYDDTNLAPGEDVGTKDRTLTGKVVASETVPLPCLGLAVALAVRSWAIKAPRTGTAEYRRPEPSSGG